MSNGVELATLLRECADVVERNEFTPALYNAIASLHEYAGRHPDADMSSPRSTAGKTAPPPPSSVSTASITSNGTSSPPKHRRQGSKSDTLAKPNHNPFGFGGLKSLTKGLGLNPGGKAAADQLPNNHSRAAATSQKNAERARRDLAELNPGGVGTSRSQSPGATRVKPSFSRPKNPNTNLIANGWLEQLRRSKMQKVWKAVLCSLVEGRKAGEETTLWVQREIVNNGKTELEALHQIPIKWLEDVQYLDYYGDHRFSLKVYNFTEEFLFKAQNEDAAQNWVLTLRSVREIVLSGSGTVSAKKAVDDQLRASSSADRSTESEVGSGAVTESAPAFAVPPSTSPIAAAGVGRPDPPSARPRMPIKELRAIAHGAGVNTAGMERSELERVVAEIQGSSAASTVPDAPSSNSRKPQPASEDEPFDAAAENERQRRAAEKKREIEEATAEKRRQQEEIARQEAQRRREAAAEEERLRIMAEAERRRAEEERQRAAAAAEEQRRRAAEEAQIRYQQQQAAWQAEQRRQEEARRQAEATRAAEAARQQAQWQAYQQQQAAAAARQQQQQQQYYAQQQRAAQQQQQQQAPPPGGVNSKYAKMATNQDEEATAAAITNIKRGILLQWALAPPHMQSLRPISDLLCTIHNVFPPAFGVPAHDYFKKWKAITPAETGDEEKLKKAHRKLRFFLHPDKLPRDLNEEQGFMCKMLWDVSNDAWEEFHKKKNDLDWISH